MLNVDSFRDRQRVIDLGTELAQVVFEPGMSKQMLDSTHILRVNRRAISTPFER